ncbi:34955_t:CDS:2 [Gigaspora margarita]|uniref:34955_t:CDS:1 n=1 Tax=Gigaspora margarita TaxID=4874 RepID=A0ABM8VZT8_GIGMA|nr:34955_t:CDS:2 [Gigaspora margarita]
MSTSTSQSGDVIIEVKTEEIGPEENCDNIHPTQIYNHGFTFVFIINIINNVYSISDFKDKELPIKYGGVVKFISKKNDIINQNDEKDKQRTDKSSQNADRYTLIILTLSGIYKYQMKNKLIKNIQKLKYPRRVYNAMIRNITSFFNFPGDLMYNAYGNEHEDINLSLNKHYFLADTTNEDIKYIELYDLKTNHLVNTFQRQNLSGSYNVDVPSYYAISNNGKLLAYASLFNKAIKIFSIECGLEIAELITDIAFIDIQIDFFRSDEILCVFSKNKWIVWDIFGALLGSVKLIDNVLDLPSKFYENIERSNSFMVVNEGNELAIYDDLIINIYLKDLKKDEEQIWKKLSNDDFSRQDPNSNIRDLQDKESKLDEYYHILEPWLIHYDRRHSNYSVYLDEKKEKLLLIGNHTIQVWHDQGPKKRSLEFIHVPLSHLPFNYEQDFMEADKSETLYMIKVIDINYCIGKFKLNIQIENIEDKSFQIKMEDKNDIMNVVQYACHSLKYLSSYKKFEWLIEEDQKLKFTNIIEQTRKIILRFIRLHPSEWRLLDIRYDLMSVLIESKEYELVKYILSFKEPLHIPQYISWEGEKNTIHTALSAYFLEYYSNKAVDNDNIGWMNTVVDIIPELCKINEKKSKKENHNIGWVNTVVDIISKLYKNNKIESDEEKANFTNNKKIFDKREKKFTDYLNLLIFPIQYSSLKEEGYSPFIKLIEKDFKQNKHDIRDILYENPSMGAVMNWIFTLLGYPFYIGLKQSPTTYEITKGNNVAYTMTGEEPDNPFSNIIGSIVAVYDWSSISFDTWNFWPLTIISIIGSFVFVIILQNIIISYMSDAFANAVKDSKRGVYRFQIDFIYDFALLEKSLEFNNLDSKFKDKIRAKYICFYDDPNITSSWKEVSEKMESEPYTITQIENKINLEFLEFLSDEDCKFIWEKAENVEKVEKVENDDKDIQYWFLE